MTLCKNKEVLIFGGFNRQSQLSQEQREDCCRVSVELVVWGSCPGSISGRLCCMTPRGTVLVGLCSRGTFTQTLHEHYFWGVQCGGAARLYIVLV